MLVAIGLYVVVVLWILWTVGHPHKASSRERLRADAEARRN